jgi:hypothetical protein
MTPKRIMRKLIETAVFSLKLSGIAVETLVAGIAAGLLAGFPGFR